MGKRPVRGIAVPGIGKGFASIEVVGFLAAITLLGHFLVTHYVLYPDSDPMRWFAYARDFFGRFGEVKLAYGFPLFAALAIEAVGPLYGFLVNVPVVLGLAALVYALARSCVSEARHVDRTAIQAILAPFGGFVALLLFIAWNSGDSSMLLRLANPYRDGLSFVFLLSSVLFVLRAADPKRCVRSALPAGLCLALACSTRETSLLMVVPFVSFASAARLRDATIPFVRGALSFGAAFAAAISPLLIQNWLLSGSAVVPGQASGSLGVTQTYFPGLGPLYFFETFPKLLLETAAHVGLTGLVLVGAGLIAAVVTRNRAVLALSLPALLTYAVFYGGYYTIVPRYLVILDLFLAPMAGVGAAALLKLGLRSVRPSALRRAAAVFCLVFAIGGTLGAVVAGSRVEWIRLDAEGAMENRFTLGDAARLRATLAAILPASAGIVAERPISSMLRCFTDYEVTALMFDNGNRNLKNPAATQRIFEKLNAHAGGRFFIGASAGTPGPAEQFLSNQFDLYPEATIQAADYHIDALYPGAETLRLERIEPWVRRESRVRVATPEGGPHVLIVDVGMLSRYARTSTRVYWNDALLEGDAVDQWNHYLVDVDATAAEALVRVESDGPVPAILQAELQPADAPVTLDLRDQYFLAHMSRLSPSFFIDVMPTAPTIDGVGSVRIPTVAPIDSVFVVLVIFSLMGDAEQTREHRLTLGVDGIERFKERVGAPDDVTEGWSWFEKRIVIDGATLGRAHSRLDVEVEAPPGLGRPPRLVLVAVEIYRYPLGNRFEVLFGQPGDKVRQSGDEFGQSGDKFGQSGDDPFVAVGFAPQPDDALELPFPTRWTGRRATIPLPVTPSEGPARLRVEYFVGARPRTMNPPAPQFSLNGVVLSGSRNEDSVQFAHPPENPDSALKVIGSLRRVTEVFVLPAGVVRGVFDTLEIESATWVPAENGVSSDMRELGVMLHRVVLEGGTASAVRARFRVEE